MSNIKVDCIGVETSDSGFWVLGDPASAESHQAGHYVADNLPAFLQILVKNIAYLPGVSGSEIFYVSPFMEMGLTYRFRFDALDEGLGVFIDDYKGDDLVLKTHILGHREPFSEWNLLRSFLRLPFISTWIPAWIHWEAMKIWLKNIPQVFRSLDGMKPGWNAES